MVFSGIGRNGDFAVDTKHIRQNNGTNNDGQDRTCHGRSQLQLT